MASRSSEQWREDVPAIWSFWVPVQSFNFLVSQTLGARARHGGGVAPLDVP